MQLASRLPCRACRARSTQTSILDGRTAHAPAAQSARLGTTEGQDSACKDSTSARVGIQEGQNSTCTFLQSARAGTLTAYSRLARKRSASARASAQDGQSRACSTLASTQQHMRAHGLAHLDRIVQVGARVRGGDADARTRGHERRRGEADDDERDAALQAQPRGRRYLARLEEHQRLRADAQITHTSQRFSTHSPCKAPGCAADALWIY